MRDVVIVAAQRTAVGSFQGALASVTAPRLGAAAIRAAVAKSGVAPEDVKRVVMGCVLPAGLGQAPARQAALGAGLPRSVPCTTVNKVCGSGLESVIVAAQAIAHGDHEVAVAGGMESMSNAPFLLPALRGGAKMGHTQALDSMIVDGLWDVYGQQHMGQCAELCAREKGITRADQDAFAAESYRRALVAQASGAFHDEIAPVTVPGKKGDTVVELDEEPGRGNVDKLPGLRPAFDKNGTVTAGNASSINDGAAAMVLMSAEAAARRGAPVLARIVAHGYHAQDPEWFTTAPIGAIEAACKRAGWDPRAVELWEINEAFSVVSLVNQRGLDLDPGRINVHGGAVAIGHPIGASGTRILVTLLHAMKTRGCRTGGASLCIGGGEAITLLVDREPS